MNISEFNSQNTVLFKAKIISSKAYDSFNDADIQVDTIDLNNNGKFDRNNCIFGKRHLDTNLKEAINTYNNCHFSEPVFTSPYKNIKEAAAQKNLEVITEDNFPINDAQIKDHVFSPNLKNERTLDSIAKELFGDFTEKGKVLKVAINTKIDEFMIYEPKT